jgi:hypothetical protein
MKAIVAAAHDDALRSRGDGLPHASGGLDRVFVLPNAHHEPPCLTKEGALPLVTSAVAGQFGVPVVAIGPGSRPVLDTSVPEAAVEEHGDSRATEDDVRSGRAATLADALMKPKPKALAVEL